MLAGAVNVLSDGERARNPGHLGIAAYFDGWSQASGGPARWFPRFLTRDEEECWRDGWKEAKAERAEYGDSRVIHSPAPAPALRLLAASAPECRRCPLLTTSAAA